jgi:hypothetical protein
MKTYGRRKDRKRGYDLPPTNTLNCHLHTQRKEKKKSVWLLATVHVGAALLGRIDNNNSREITSLVVAVEPCVQKATNPISKLSSLVIQLFSVRPPLSHLLLLSVVVILFGLLLLLLS